MSKKILIELTADEIQQILCVCSDSVAKRLIEARDSKKHFSVLEWHPMNEKPDNKELLVRMDNGLLVFDYAVAKDEEWRLQYHAKNHAIEWAYLPERKP